MFTFIWSIIVLLWKFSPIWLPIACGIIAWEMWLDYVRAKFAASKPKVLFEVKLPQEILKSPLAMEVVLTSMYVTSREGTFIDRYIKGQSRPQFSLELVSIGGKIHFYVWTEKDFRQVIESQIYSQYPNIEIHDAEDYTKGHFYEPGITEMFGAEFIKTAGDSLPIKTYIDYGLDRDPKEEMKIDPITPTLEFLGALKQGEEVWLQIILKAHKKEKVIKKNGKRVKVDWTESASEYKQKFIDSLKDKTNPSAPARRMTKGEEQIISAIERNVSKLPFDVGIRGVYFAQKDAFSGVTRTGLMGTIRQYNANNLNGFKPNNVTGFDYPWQDFRNIRTDGLKRKMLSLYKSRSYFHESKRHTFVMNTEELATMYHYPGAVAGTPNVARIMSKKSEAPSNLPI